MKNQVLFLFILIFAIGCNEKIHIEKYEHHLDLLGKHTKTIELIANDGQARLIVVPEFQGRVATSTNFGVEGNSLGWLNIEVLESDKKLNGSEIHGEERVWIGPQGGQYSFYYGQKKPLDEDNWNVPTSFNGEPFNVVIESNKQIIMNKTIKLTNHIGTKLKMELGRKIEILEIDEIERRLKTIIPDKVKVVAYESIHQLVNRDTFKWQKETGLAGIWSLSTFKGSNKTVTFIPLKPGASQKEVFQYLNAFEKDRYTIMDNVVWYKTDGKYRSKIGIPPESSLGYFGSYQPETNTLRIIKFSQTENDSFYFNSDVTVQENPYQGEVIAVYNSGPMDLEVGKNNSFFEMESMAAMKDLHPNEYVEHIHEVYQFTGDFEELNEISVAFLGVELKNNPLD